MDSKMKLVKLVGSKVEAEYPLDAEVLRLGREQARTIPIDDPSVSRRHAEITCGAEGVAARDCSDWTITDLGSTNGTFINEERLTGSRRLRPGDQIRVGNTVFNYEEVESGRRFRNVVAILIAFSTIVGAVIAWRIAVASSNAASADVDGIVSTVSLQQATVASEADLYRDVTSYVQVRIHNLLSQALFAEREQYPDGDPARDRLWDEGWTETHVAEAYLDNVNIRPEHIRPDGSYDGQAAQDIDMAHRSLDADFNREEHFDQADHLRVKAQWLTGIAFLLTFTLLFYTLAEVITHASKYLFLILGSGIFIMVLLAFPVIELTMG
jgi:hypothetical protein